MDQAMHGQWTKPCKPRRTGRLLSVFMAAALGLWICGPCAAGETKAPQAGGYRSLTLAGTGKHAGPRLFPLGSYERHLPGGAGKGLAIRSNWRDMKIPAGPDGHFYVTARVKRQPPSYALVNITFLVDTGASLVALTRADAEALGFELRHLEFSGISQTANGEVRFASVTLPELRVGSFKVKNLPASVVDGELEISLLGNSFLSQLKSYQVANDQLILRW